MIPRSFSNFTGEEIDFFISIMLEEESFFRSLPTSQILEQSPVTANPREKERKCFSSFETNAKVRYKDPSNKQKDLCNRCYHTQRKALTQIDESSSNPLKKPRIV